MNTYEKLLDKACKDGIDVIDYPFNSDRIDGLYCDGTIAIRQNIETSIEKACVLAEELGHYYTSYGDITDMNDINSRQQEYDARLWGFNEKIGLFGIIKAFEHGCRNRYETAEYLETTEEYLEEALKCYKSKYGVYRLVDNYAITFIPNLAVIRML